MSVALHPVIEAPRPGAENPVEEEPPSVGWRLIGRFGARGTGRTLPLERLSAHLPDLSRDQEDQEKHQDQESRNPGEGARPQHLDQKVAEGGRNAHRDTDPGEKSLSATDLAYHWKSILLWSGFSFGFLLAGFTGARDIFLVTMGMEFGVFAQWLYTVARFEVNSPPRGRRADSGVPT
ncbi:MAG TPA: hypothetical protein VGV89_10450 [Thermoplasmata archaeon]|nr:hypothetical protein [Thermoplasmata archaeon]